MNVTKSGDIPAFMPCLYLFAILVSLSQVLIHHTQTYTCTQTHSEMTGQSLSVVNYTMFKTRLP